MNGNIDYLLLTLGSLRTAVWLFGAAHGYAHKRILQTAVCVCTSYSSMVFALGNAGIHVDPVLFNLAVGLGVPQVVGVVGVFVVNAISRASADSWHW